MTPTTANNFGLTADQWKAVLKKIQNNWSDADIMGVTGFKLSTIRAIRADYEALDTEGSAQ